MLDPLTLASQAQRWDAYQECLKRGHTPLPLTLTSNPPLSVCRFCGTSYRLEQRLIEQNKPEPPDFT